MNSSTKPPVPPANLPVSTSWLPSLESVQLDSWPHLAPSSRQPERDLSINETTRPLLTPYLEKRTTGGIHHLSVPLLRCWLILVPNESPGLRPPGALHTWSGQGQTLCLQHTFQESRHQNVSEHFRVPPPWIWFSCSQKRQPASAWDSNLQIGEAQPSFLHQELNLTWYHFSKQQGS